MNSKQNSDDIKRIDRIMITAPASGSGKTIFTCGLLSLLKDEGRDPASFKCGPDYIDPMFHREVLGIDGDNLDPFFSDDEELVSILASCGRGTAVLEGAMGIYDGIAGETYKGSCYEVACATKTPIVLLVNVKGMGTTLLSIIKGILADDRQNMVRGIVLNRISDQYYEKISPLVTEMLSGINGERGVDCRLLGGIPDSKDTGLGSRHLGLVMPGEYSDLNDKIRAFADLIKAHLDMDILHAVMAEAADLHPVKSEDCGDHVRKTDGALKIAVARDEAFCFYYKENLNELRRHGIEPVSFSPLHDISLPDGVSGMLLGGGYPELYAGRLSANSSMIDSVRSAISRGMPSLAECGGFMYLLDLIRDEDGTEHSMAGVINGSSNNTGRLGRFGYITVTGKENTDSLLSGLSIKGHEFHYYDSDNNGSDALALKPGSGRSWECMHAGYDHVWGYPHFYYPSCPELIDRFAEAMKSFDEK